jgi:hypothetical protein
LGRRILNRVDYLSGFGPFDRQCQVGRSLGSLMKKQFVNLRWDRKNGNAVNLTDRGIKALEKLAKL